MAFLGAALPYITAAGAAVGAAQKYSSDRFNAQVLSNEQKLAVDQSNAQEGQVRRASRQQLGAQAAAFGAAGVGYDGSSEGALDQSALNHELDALNTRYRGTVAGYGYGVQSSSDRSQANSDLYSGLLMAGGRALSQGFNYGPRSAKQQAGLEAPS